MEKVRGDMKLGNHAIHCCQGGGGGLGGGGAISLSVGG